MAEEVVGIKIKVDGSEASSSVGSLKQQLRQATNEVAALAEQFGATSKEAIGAAKRAAELKDKIGDAKSLIDAFNPDAKFKALSASIQGVAGGFAAVQGAMGLMGVEGENVQKTLLKVQSALAISQGLQSLGESIDSFKQLGAVIKTTVVNAFSTLRGAIAATGIGALAVALGYVITNFDTVKEKVLNLFPGVGKLASYVGDLVEKFTDFVGVTSEAERNLDALEAKTKRGNEAIDARIKVLSAQGGKEKEIYELSKQSGENELNFLRDKLKTKGKLTDEELKKFRDLKTEQEVLDAKEQKRIADDLKDKNKKAAEAGKQASEKQKQLLKEKADAERDAADRIAKLTGETAVLGIKNEYDAKRQEIDNQLAADIKQVQDNEKLKAETKDALIKALNAKSDADYRKVAADEAADSQKTYLENQKKFAEDQRQIAELGIQGEIEALDKKNAKYEMDYEADLERLELKKELLDQQMALELENSDLTEFQKTEIRKKYADARAEVAQKEVEVEKAAQDAKVELNNKYLDLYAQFGGFLQQIAGKNKTLAIAGVVVEQAASIGRIISNTAVANAKAVAASPMTAGMPFVALNTASGALSIASSVAAGIKAVQQINAAQPGGGGGAAPASGSMGAAPIAPAAPVTNTVTQLDQKSMNAVGNATSRAYVVESDVTNSQERITRINRAARLG
jgi:hypothetical protein